MLLRILLVLALLFGSSAIAIAQDKGPMSPEEAEQLMNSIADKMRQLEQMLAKASLEPDDLSAIMEQLRHAAEEKNFTHLPRSLREFLLNNPDLLAKLKNPQQTGDDLLQTEDEIRRLLATKKDGLEELLRENPEMLERLLEQQDTMEEALRQHNQVENDLERLFDQTAEQMKSTEGDIEKLMDLAEQMQQQMNQQAQNNRDQLNQPQPQPQEQEGDRQTENDSVEDPQGQGAEENPQGRPGTDATGRPLGQNDPEAWDMILPRTERERNQDPSATPKPRGWEAEASRYFRLLAEQARKEREREERRRRERGE